MQTLVAPQSLHPLAVTTPALALEQHVDAPVAVAGMATGEHVETLAQQPLVSSTPATATLRGAVLTSGSTRPPLRNPEAALQMPDGPAAPLRGQKFPRATSRNMSLSSSFSASNRFNLAFSFSNCFNRATSSGRIALYCTRQR